MHGTRNPGVSTQDRRNTSSVPEPTAIGQDAIHAATAGGPIPVLFAVPTPPPYSGPETQAALILATGLGPRFHVFHVCTNVQRSNADKGRVTMSSLAALLRIWVTLVRALIRHRPRAAYVHLSQNVTGFVRDAMVILTLRAGGVAVVAHIHGGNFARFRETTGAVGRRLIAAVVRQLALVIVLGERFRPHVDDLLPGRVRVVLNPVDLALFTPPQPRPGDDGCHVLFVGHLSVAKGFGDLLDALSRALAERTDLRVSVIGEWQPHERNIFIDDNGRPIARDVDSLHARWDTLCHRFPGRARHRERLGRQTIAEVYRTADIFVLPSYSEGLPMSVLEGLASALPLIVTPVGALPEVLDDGVHAMFVPCGGGPALADAILALARDPARRRAMGCQNRRLAEDRFAPRLVAAQLAQCLIECVA